MKKQLTVGWKVSTLNLGLASLRYRALLPMVALEELEVKSRILFRPKSSDLAKIDVLVIVKSFTLEDYWLAQEAVKMNIPVIFDLCDNIFIEPYRGRNTLSPSEVFLQISSLASAIVVPTEPLARIVEQKMIRSIPVYVVADGIETPEILEKAKNRLFFHQLLEYCYRLLIRARKQVDQLKIKFSFLRTGSPTGVSRGFRKELIRFRKELIRFAKRVFHHVFRRMLRYSHWRFWAKMAYSFFDRRLRTKLTGASPKLGPQVVSPIIVEQSVPLLEFSSKIVWFGNHGAEHADFGMLDLLRIREPLEKLAREFPVELIVISNNHAKFNKYIRSIEIPTRYVEWKANSIAEHLREADVVVIPNSLDEFSICKSANRTVLSLFNGVPVVATSTPALEDLRDCIMLDDFENGLRRYLTDAEFAKKHVQKGQESIERLFGKQQIGKLWKELIDSTISCSSKQDNLFKPELIFAIHLPQDIELATPILDTARKCGIQCAIWSNLFAIQRWPYLCKWIQSQKFDWRILPQDLKDVDVNVFPDSAFALFSVTETNLNPHCFTHQLTKLANHAGLYTATLQHGFENVGLSYSDDIHAIERIRIASTHIYTWGSLETLHQNIPRAIRDKCIPVGCPKSETVEKGAAEWWNKSGRPIIGVFENLHWHRYSDEYRKFFLDSVLNIAGMYPEVDFLIKPHNAGLWLTSRYQGEKPEMENLIIVDPKEPRWNDKTASQLFGHLVGVITTPSTVALDAARAKMSVAVVARGLDAKNYEPLPLINGLDDWHSFIELAVDERRCKDLKEKSQQFVNRVLLPGDAASRIIESIVSYKQKLENKDAA